MQNLDKLPKKQLVQMITLIMVRMAKAFNKYVAGKVNFTYMRSGMQIMMIKNTSGIDRNTINYINVYGDEVATNIKGVGLL
jgi:hypothetical protein